jgi:hypothetical protein
MAKWKSIYRFSVRRIVEVETAKGADALDRRPSLLPRSPPVVQANARCPPSWTVFHAMWPS